MPAPNTDIVVVDEVDKKAVVIDVAATNDSNIGKKEHVKLENYLEQLEKMRGVKTSVILLVIRALGAVNPKQQEWLQQIPRATSVISVQKMEREKHLIYNAGPSSSQASDRRPQFPVVLHHVPYLTELVVGQC